ncbi:hypothetical protein [Kineosporia sp. NBRC 101731]|uniref:hypothetical protein n=1 Tax=Kineosporia sp. NBRC 101731 TaxID=3032199 RepID=UPI00249FDD65|nr:hypothetical protein [Kineosporia sp. NBRC 101731]GLY31134.1 hypothetical protein Kisp02_44990 [Kineosporia sp. NBRC 101731]
MRKFKTPALLTIAATAAIATGFVALPANAATDCEITAPGETTVSLGLERTKIDLTPTTNCPTSSSVEFAYTADWRADVPTTRLNRDFWFKTYLNGNPKAEGSENGTMYVERTDSGNILAGQPMQAHYQAFVDDGRANWDNGETKMAFDTTYTILRATRFSSFTTGTTDGLTPGDNIGFEAEIQRADWDAGVWRAFSGNGIFDVQFKADGTDDWTTVATRQGGYGGLRAPVSTDGDYRLKYSGDVVSGASYSDPIHVTVA